MTTMEKHHRRSIRLRGYDYTQPGAYFVTICIEGRPCLLGEIEGDVMRLNDAGQMVQTTWEAIPAQHSGVEIDAFVLMPNHIHGIIVLVGAPRKKDDVSLWEITRVAPTDTRQPENALLLGDVVGAFKSLTTDAYIHGVKTSGWPSFQGRLWQRNYYEHIIRNEAALEYIRQYIVDNPVRWAFDSENPSRITP